MVQVDIENNSITTNRSRQAILSEVISTDIIGKAIDAVNALTGIEDGTTVINTILDQPTVKGRETTIVYKPQLNKGIVNKPYIGEAAITIANSSNNQGKRIVEFGKHAGTLPREDKTKTYEKVVEARPILGM
jgi:hypothetical protein